MALTIDRTLRSPNFDSRPVGTAIDGIVIHTGEGTRKSDLAELTSPSTKVSAHYYVDRTGHVNELVDPTQRAWHAGVSAYMGRTSWNNFSIGIESEHKQGQDWPAVQKDAYAELVEYLIARYPIKEPYVAAHRWIAPTRKTDPTDWPDRELIPWIDNRFDDVWNLRWGPIATPDQTSWDWDIPKTWKFNWQRLGFCIGSALYDHTNALVIQSFEGGDVRQRAQRLPEVCFR